jgi:hypothetical protein
MAGRAIRAISLFALAFGVMCLGGGCTTAPKCRPVTVSGEIFAGCRPRTQADFDGLRREGVRTILSLEALPWHIWPERRRAREIGLIYRNVPIMASPLEPSEQQVKRALLTLTDQALHPIFLHCFLGEDRAVFIIGLYRIYYEHWTPEAAWQEMLRSGFHPRRTLRGFVTYFWNHTKTPDWAIRTGRQSGTMKSAGGHLLRPARPPEVANGQAAIDWSPARCH